MGFADNPSCLRSSTQRSPRLCTCPPQIGQCCWQTLFSINQCSPVHESTWYLSRDWTTPIL